MKPDRETLARLAAGHTAAEIAELHGVHRSTVWRWLTEAGLPPPENVPGGREHTIKVRLSDEERERAQARADALGVSLAELARRGLIGPDRATIPISDSDEKIVGDYVRRNAQRRTSRPIE